MPSGNHKVEPIRPYEYLAKYVKGWESKNALEHLRRIYLQLSDKYGCTREKLLSVTGISLILTQELGDGWSHCDPCNLFAICFHCGKCSDKEVYGNWTTGKRKMKRVKSIYGDYIPF